MRRFDLQGKHMGSLLTYYSEFIEVHSKINVKSLYPGSVFKYGAWWLRDRDFMREFVRIPERDRCYESIH